MSRYRILGHTGNPLAEAEHDNDIEALGWAGTLDVEFSRVQRHVTGRLPSDDCWTTVFPYRPTTNARVDDGPNPSGHA